MQKPTLIEQQEIFLYTEIQKLAFNGAFQRAGIYAENVSDYQKNELRNCLIARLDRIVQKYQDCPWGNEDHYEIIDIFCAEVSRECLSNPSLQGVLKNGKFRFGVGQKLINLYMKYLWCVGKIIEPPHCPFDGIVISKLRDITKWTRLDKKEDYQKLVALARIEAKGSSLAEWELKTFNDIRI